MSFFTTTSRIMGNSVKHVLRNPWDSITAILVMTLTVFVTSALGVMLYSSDKMLAFLENRLEVTAFFAENTTEDYILAIKQELEAQRDEMGVEQVRYISQDEALEIFKRQNDSNPETLEFVTADILPASLSVSARQLADLQVLAERLAEDERVEEVLYQRDVAEKFEAWSSRIRLVGIGFSVYLLAMSVLILLIVMSLSIREFSKEIEVMRLVGASTGYIRWPFIFDGIFYGVFAAVVSTIGIYFLLPYVQQFSNELVGGLVLFDNVYLFTVYVFALSTGLGIVLGVTGSILAIRKHLKV